MWMEIFTANLLQMIVGNTLGTTRWRNGILSKYNHTHELLLAVFISKCDSACHNAFEETKQKH